MRRGVTAIAALGALACGGDRVAPRAPAANPPGAPPAVPAAVVEVEMAGDGVRSAAFDPAAITIAPGATVRFVNVSVGVAHNVVFWEDSIPPGAGDKLTAAMPDRVDRLFGPYVAQPNATYEVTFPTDAPPGEYGAYCLSHLALGMRLRVTVR
jgi:plastocyanin